MQKETYQIMTDKNFSVLIGREELPLFLVNKTVEFCGQKITYLDLEESFKTKIHYFIKENPGQLDKAVQIIHYVANCAQGFSNLEIAHACYEKHLDKRPIKKKQKRQNIYGHCVLAPLILENLLAGKPYLEIVKEYKSFFPSPSYECPVLIASKEDYKGELLDAPLLHQMKSWEETTFQLQIKNKLPINWRFLISHYLQNDMAFDLYQLVMKSRQALEQRTEGHYLSLDIKDCSQMIKYFSTKVDDQFRQKILGHLFETLIQRLFKVSNGYRANHDFEESPLKFDLVKNCRHELFNYYRNNKKAVSECLNIPLMNWGIFFDRLGIDENDLKTLGLASYDPLNKPFANIKNRFCSYNKKYDDNLWQNASFKKKMTEISESVGEFDESLLEFMLMLKKAGINYDQQLLLPYLNEKQKGSYLATMKIMAANHDQNLSLGLVKLFKFYENKKVIRILLEQNKTEDVICHDTIFMAGYLEESELPSQSSFKDMKDLHDVLKVELLKKQTVLQDLNQDEIMQYDNLHITMNNSEYVIKVPKTNHDLLLVGEQLNNCVGIYGYSDKIIAKKTLVFYLEKDEKPHACIEVMVDRNREECFHTIQAVLWGNIPWPEWPHSSQFTLANKKFKFR